MSGGHGSAHSADRYIVLPNSPEVLLISDPDTDKSTASMNVSVSSFSGPDGLECRAHYLASHKNTDVENADLEKEESYLDPAWPHPHIGYELLLRTPVSDESGWRVDKRCGWRVDKRCDCGRNR